MLSPQPFSLLALMVLLTSCSDEVATSGNKETKLTPARWYYPQQVAEGKTVYEQHCTACHNENAEGTADWKKRRADGSLPPPPLNGSAHTWHHPLPVLFGAINNGGKLLGGNMPGFREVLTDEEKQAVIAYFQSFWTDATYQRWEQMAGRDN